MAAISSAGSGPWTTGGTWVGGVAPTTADDATVLNTHTVTFDATTCVARSLTVNSGGIVAASTSASSKITCQFNFRVLAGGTHEVLLSSLPAITHEVRVYAAAAGAAGTTNSTPNYWALPANTINLQAYERKRWTKLKTTVAAGASTFVVNDATNWRVGDRLVFMAQTANGAAGTDEQVVITSITPGTGTEATIAFTNASAGTTLLLAHTAPIPIANFTSNITIGPSTANTGGIIRLDNDTGACIRRLRHVLLDQAGQGLNGDERGVYISWLGSNAGTGSLVDLTGMAFYRSSYNMGNWMADNWPAALGPWSLDDMVNWSDVGNSPMLRFQGTPFAAQTINRWLMMRGNASGAAEFNQTNSVWRTVTFNDSHFALMSNFYAPFYDVTFNSCDFWSTQYGPFITVANGKMVFNNCRNGGVYGATTNNTGESPRGTSFGIAAESNGTSWNGLGQSASWTMSGAGEVGRWVARAGGGTATDNRIYTLGGAIDSDTGTTRNSPTSAKCVNRVNSFTASDVRIVQTFTVAVAPGVSTTIKFSGRIDSNYTGTSYPYVRAVLDGTELTRWTKSSTANVWEDGSITFSHASAATRLVTIEFAGNPTNKTTSNFWFSGMPFDPCIGAARWYGWLFDDTNPVVTVDPYLNTTTYPEATALAYTGVTINTGTERVSFAGGTANTFEKLYAHGQAYGASSSYFNGMGYYEMPWTRAGALLSLSTGWTIVDPVITGMTWGGGNIEFNSAGTKTGAFDTTTLTFTAAGSYAMGGSTFSGTITLINTSGGAVTLALPSGTTVNNIGPNITVTTPVINQSATITGVVAGSRVQIYDTTNSVELYNGTGPVYSWTDGSAAVAPRSYRVRIANVSGTTAYQFLEAAIGTSGVISTDAAVTYLANQSLDTVYNTNAIDGSTVTDITISDALDRVIIAAAGGAKTYPQIYAYQCYWLSTALGIVDDGAFISASDTANYSFTGFQIRNTSATPLTITGGYGVDSTTGTSAALIDTAGSTGNIFLAPDHVVPFSTGSGLTAGQAVELTTAANSSTLAAAKAALAAALSA